ncbi:MAG: endonuclease/exonuclease/phosphatase family protein [Thermoanaerobaculia bacterium]
MSTGRPARRTAALPFGRTLGLCLFAVWAVGQLFRDLTLVTAWAFYLPSALVLGALLLLAAFEALRRRRRRAMLLLALALAPVAAVLAFENRWLPRSHPLAGTADLRVVAWNVADFPRGVERAAALLRPLEADLVLLSEAPGKPPQELEHQLGGGLRLTPVGGMAIFTREAPLEVEWLARESELQVALVRWPVAGRTLGVLAVNVISSPRVPRDPLLARVVEMIERHEPDLVLGDFNAPRRSRALARLPAGFRHAYDAAGFGWSSTWPAALPLLAIDQTIVGPRLAVRDYTLRTTRISDHRLQLTELDFAVPPAGGSG